MAFPVGPSESKTLELLSRVRGGEDGAWNELFRRHHDQLLFAVRMRLGPDLRKHLQSVDIFQSVALESLRALEGFEYRGPGSLNRFLNTLVTNKIRDRADTFRAHKRAGTVPLPDDISSAPESAYQDPELYERLERSLASLPEDFREVLLLRKVEGLSSKEVAERLDKSDEAVRKSYSRALARLTLAMGVSERS
jgi:RNA polymerase sigma-70 factor (ECF subfamily)